jgi:hypothetical protein
MQQEWILHYHLSDAPNTAEVTLEVQYLPTEEMYSMGTTANSHILAVFSLIHIAWLTGRNTTLQMCMHAPGMMQVNPPPVVYPILLENFYMQKFKRNNVLKMNSK